MHHPHFHHHHPVHGPRGHHHGGDHGPGLGPRHEDHAPHQRRRERIFEAGGLKLITLHLLAQQPSHGYDIIRAVGELVGGDYQPSPGTIYPTLSYLVDMGHATATEAEGGRKQYAITAQGQQALQEQDAALQKLLQRLSRSKERDAQRRPPALVRALENFRTALRLKLDGLPGQPAAPLSEAQIAALARLLDDTALQLEKV